MAAACVVRCSEATCEDLQQPACHGVQPCAAGLRAGACGADAGKRLSLVRTSVCGRLMRTSRVTRARGGPPWRHATGAGRSRSDRAILTWSARRNGAATASRLTRRA